MTPNRELVSRIAVLAEHIARSKPTAEEIESLLSVDPHSPTTVALWEGLAKRLAQGVCCHALGVRSKEVSRRASSDQIRALRIKLRFWRLPTNGRLKASMRQLHRFRGELFTAAFDTDKAADERLTAWNQAIKLSPSSSSHTGCDRANYLRRNLSPDVGTQAIAALQAARVQGLAIAATFDSRKSWSYRWRAASLTLLLARADTTEELLQAIADGKCTVHGTTAGSATGTSESPHRSNRCSGQGTDGIQRSGGGFESSGTR